MKMKNIMKYGIKAYGDWKFFDTRSKYRKYLMEWIACTDGSERDRAVEALSNLECGYEFTDTDRETYFHEYENAK